MALVFLLTNTVMNRALHRAESQYIDNCSLVLEGYSGAIYYYFENYHTSLSSIYNEPLFAAGDNKAIQKWLIDNVSFIHEDFCTTFYIDMATMTGYFSQGSVLDLTGRDYISPDNFAEGNYFVSDLVNSPYADYPVFIIEEPFYNEKNEIKGILCAAILLDRLEKIAKTIIIGDHTTVTIADKKGKLMVHPDASYVGKVFVPKSEKYRTTTSIVTAKEGNGVVETENYLGEPIDLFYSRIKNSGWTLGVSFPKKYLHAVYRQQNSTKIKLVIIALAALLLLLFVESAIMDYFYNNHLIDIVYDPFTGLWTRQHFESVATKLMQRNPKAKFMLVESDIRGFKFINQNYGEEEADKMINFYASLIKEISKRNHGIVAHGYADHFYSLIKITDVSNAMTLFKKEMDNLSEKVKQYDIPFFPKFGITFFRQGNKREVTVKELIGQASFAKSTIKDNMLVSYAIYNSRLLEKINEEHYIERTMENALKNEEFFVMYQPKISLANDLIVGAEALVRWKTPELGLLTPDKFIPLFERNGFIIKLDFYVYDKVFKFLDEQIKAGKPVVPISVNMSRNHNKPEKFMHEFMALFNKYNIPPHLVQVEILERSVMDSNTLCEITNRLHEKGFTVAMDDFGSGESSLNMLTKVPVDVLKFDREFLLSSTNEQGDMDEKSAKFIQSLLDLSKHLDKQTVFEGVETRAQRDFLRASSCDQVQGYFYSKPLNEQDFIVFTQEYIA
ncbi:MAG: GGDEF domain-containing protein [Treponema sp.]|nr:GGDEF domain-containing protein [Treponema sp.]